VTGFSTLRSTGLVCWACASTAHANAIKMHVRS